MQIILLQRMRVRFQSVYRKLKYFILSPKSLLIKGRELLELMVWIHQVKQYLPINIQNI